MTECPECNAMVDTKVIGLHRSRSHGYRVQHGTASRYANSKCRCDLCRDAWRIEMMRRRRGWGVKSRDAYNAERSAQVKHGTATKYGPHKCRCEICRRWARESRAKTRAKVAARKLRGQT